MPVLDKRNPESVAAVQRYLIDNGYLTEEAARGGWGPKSQAAYDRMVSDGHVPVMSFGEYMYRSGNTGLFRRLENLRSVAGNLAAAFGFPHGDHAFLSEGGRRQMVGAASYSSPDEEHKYQISDKDHELLGGMVGHSGNEFRTARESGAGLKAAIESAASIRGIDVQADDRSTIVNEETMEKYRREYEKYLRSCLNLFIISCKSVG